ncbi:MAG: MMPL family transporter, partial [Pirellulales bacterium]|nr:MMPL family transporter [Pirellulales bacterium]
MKETFFARRAFLILAVLVFLLPLIWVGSKQALLKNRNDVKTWLPDGFQETADYAWFDEHFPHDQFILASWEGCTLDDPRLDFFARKLRAHTEEACREGKQPFFKNVLTGKELVDQTAKRFEGKLSRESVIERLQGSLIGDDNKKTCLLVFLADVFHGTELSAAIQCVKDTANQCDVLGDVKTIPKGCPIPKSELHLGGPPVDNAAIDYEGKRTLIKLAGWSAVIGLGLSWLCFRSLRLTAVIFSCAILAAGIGLSIVFYSDGLVDAILLSMPSLVYVLAMSGAIHIINYYHDAIHDRGLRGAPERALAHGWKPCTLAAITTSIGLLSLCNSNLIPVRNFGLYSALGVLATLALLFLVVPACLSLWPSREFARQAKLQREDEDQRNTRKHTIFHVIWHKIGGQVIRHNGLVVTGCVAVMIFFALGTFRIQPSIKLMKLFSPEARILADYGWLEKHLGPLVPMEVVIRLDRDKTKDMSFAQRMRLARDVEYVVEHELEPVGGALSAATFAPDLGKTKFKWSVFDRAGEKARSNKLEAHREDFADYLRVDEKTNEELWRVSARVDALSDLDYGEFVNELRTVVEPEIQYYRDHGIDGISVTYTGLVPLVYKAQTELLQGLFRSLIMAFALIAIVMMLVLRSFSAGLISMVPNLFPVVIIFGAMGWLGILVDVGSMMTASVALGVAVDDTIHYLTWFRHGLDLGYSRKRAAMTAYQRCATAMSQTTLIGGLGLAVFALSSFTPTQRFGYIMLTLLFAALIGDLIFLPALLTGPFGRFFDRRRGKGSETRPPDDWSSPSRRTIDHDAQGGRTVV